MKNTPWDLSQLGNYLNCQVIGMNDPNYLITLKRSYPYVSLSVSNRISESEVELASLIIEYDKFAISARTNFFLGYQKKALLEQEYASNLLRRIQIRQAALGKAQSFSSMSRNRDLLNF